MRAAEKMSPRLHRGVLCFSTWYNLLVWPLEAAGKLPLSLGIPALLCRPGNFRLFGLG